MDFSRTPWSVMDSGVMKVTIVRMFPRHRGQKVGARPQECALGRSILASTLEDCKAQLDENQFLVL